MIEDVFDEKKIIIDWKTISFHLYNFTGVLRFTM